MFILLLSHLWKNLFILLFSKFKDRNMLLSMCLNSTRDSELLKMGFTVSVLMIFKALKSINVNNSPSLQGRSTTQGWPKSLVTTDGLFRHREVVLLRRSRWVSKKSISICIKSKDHNWRKEKVIFCFLLSTSIGIVKIIARKYRNLWGEKRSWSMMQKLTDYLLNVPKCLFKLKRKRCFSTKMMKARQKCWKLLKSWRISIRWLYQQLPSMSLDRLYTRESRKSQYVSWCRQRDVRRGRTSWRQMEIHVHWWRTWHLNRERREVTLCRSCCRRVWP